MKLLFLSASPGKLRPDREIRDIEDGIRRSTYRDAFDISTAWAVRPEDITGALLRFEPHIVHFSGHGEHDSGIFLEDERGRPISVSPDTFARLFEPLRGITRLVILNACETRPVAEALRYLVDYVISMRKPITDEAAVVFSAGFYEALALGQSVRGAFDLALTRLRLMHIPESDKPELIERPGLGPPFVAPASRRRKSPSRHPKQRGGATINIYNSPFRDIVNMG